MLFVMMNDDDDDDDNDDNLIMMRRWRVSMIVIIRRMLMMTIKTKVFSLTSYATEAIDSGARFNSVIRKTGKKIRILMTMMTIEIMKISMLLWMMMMLTKK